MAEAEARRLLRETIRADGKRIVDHLSKNPEARAELEMYGTPIGDVP